MLALRPSKKMIAAKFVMPVLAVCQIYR